MNSILQCFQFIDSKRKDALIGSELAFDHGHQLLEENGTLDEILIKYQ